MKEAKKLLSECKNDLAEIRALIDIIRSLPPENLPKVLGRLSSQNKAVILKLMTKSGNSGSHSKILAYIA